MKNAVATIPATAAGTVSKIFIKNGDKISVGAKILSLNESGGGGGAAKPAAASATKAESRPAPKPRAAQPVAEAPEEEPAEESSEDVEQSNGSVAAAPSIRRMASELGIGI